MIALDLFAALMAADLPNRDMIVLAEVLLQTYGPQKRRDVILDPATIEHYTGLHRNNGRAGIKGLVAASMLRPNADGTFRFVKDYERWTPRGVALGDRLLGGLLRFARSAVGRFGRPPKPIKKSKKVAIQGDCGANSTELRFPADLNSTELGETGAPQFNRIADLDVPPSPVGDATPTPATAPVAPLAGACPRASEDRKMREEREGESLRSSPLSGGAGGGGGREFEPLTHEGPDGVVRPIKPQVDNDPAEVDRVAEWAERAFPLLEFGAKVRQFAVMYPIGWIERSLGVSAAMRGLPSSFAPVHNRLVAWRKQGGPPEPEAQPTPGPGKPAARSLDETLAGMAAARAKAGDHKARLAAAVAAARAAESKGGDA